MTSMQFAATVHKLQIDKEGEAKLILTIPLSDMKSVLPLAGSQNLLKVTVVEDETAS